MSRVQGKFRKPREKTLPPAQGAQVGRKKAKRSNNTRTTNSVDPSPKKKEKAQSSNQTRTPSLNDMQSNDKGMSSTLPRQYLPCNTTINNLEDGKPRYKKTPRKDTEDSDADEMLSPSEVVKTKRAQRRRSTRSLDGRAEVRMIDRQETPVRPRGRRSKTPAIEE